jgi:CRISPR/Cas system-associated protein endoribonuclease Cas2
MLIFNKKFFNVNNLFIFAYIIKQLKTMTKQNIKKVKITIPNDSVLKLVTTTPIFKRLTKLKLVLGENIEQVNHYQFAEQIRMFPIAGVEIEEIK